MGRSRITIQLTRITICLPIALEKAMQDQNAPCSHQRNVRAEDNRPMLPCHLNNLICGIDVILERMEHILK